jgi:hypothetical protein
LHIDDRARGAKGGESERTILVCCGGQSLCPERIVIQRKGPSLYEVREVITTHGQCLGKSVAPLPALSGLSTIRVAARSVKVKEKPEPKPKPRPGVEPRIPSRGEIPKGKKNMNNRANESSNSNVGKKLKEQSDGA